LLSALLERSRFSPDLDVAALVWISVWTVFATTQISPQPFVRDHHWCTLEYLAASRGRSTA
jgi:hypothetical protein